MEEVDDEISVKYSFFDNRVLGYSYNVISQFVSEKVDASKEMYASLFFNVSGVEIGSAHILSRKDYISLSSNSVERNRLFLYANIPVIVSENKVTEDNIISICIDDMRIMDGGDRTS